MSKIRVELTSVQAVKGQGIGEGNLEINIKVKEGRHKVHWPDPYPAYRVVDQGGAIYGVDDATVATYEVASGKLSKKYTIEVKEIDKGTLGRDDIGFGALTFDLTPTMAPSTKYSTIELKRPNMKKALGKIKVGMTAQRI